MDRYLEILDLKNFDKYKNADGTNIPKPDEFMAVIEIIHKALTKSPDEKIDQQFIEGILGKHAPNIKIQKVSPDQIIRADSILKMAADMVAMMHAETKVYKRDHGEDHHPAIQSLYKDMIMANAKKR